MKLHPDRIRESGDLYDNYFDEWIADPFEEVHEMADAFLFTEVGSSTFGFALLTNRPVIFFDTMLNMLWEEVHEPLHKRCRIIPSQLTSEGRWVFDEDALVEALRSSPELPDEDFVKTYLIP